MQFCLSDGFISRPSWKVSSLSKCSDDGRSAYTFRCSRVDVFVCVFVCVDAQQVHAQSPRLLLCYGYFAVELCALREKKGLAEF